MNLFYKKYGTGFPLIILHGLYGSGDNWQTIGKKLAENNEVFLIDQRNHGNSPHTKLHNYSLMADDLFQFFEAQKIEKANIIGHSMGGKTAMLFTQLFPQKINKLIVVDISPKTYINTNESKEHFYILDCLQNINFKICKSYNDIDKQLSNTLKDERLRSFLLKSVKREGRRCFSWKINIPVLINELPSIFAGINETPVIHNETLFIKGSLSKHIEESDTVIIKKTFANVSIKTIEKAGHWVHAEQPAEFLFVVNDFLRNV